ncbi:hypothetical protein C0991_001240 [Blastosporella zonata]|nr:hypothetical protein C0991_001240 [Blastosporella zonata]
MPSVRPSDASSLERLNRASLVKILTNRRFDSRISSLVESPSLKLVQTITGNNQDHPLPLSPTPSQADDATSHIIPTYSGVPPEYTDERKKKNRISRPYALTPSSAFNCPSLSGVDKQVPTPILNSFSPVLLPVNLSPLSVPLPAVYNKDIAPETISRSPLVKSIVSPNLKQRERRKPSIRIRRSPAIGPSPLRAMILADPSDSKIAVKISQMGSRHSNTSLDYSCLGLGFPKSPSSTRDNNYEAESSSDGEYLQLENDSKALSATLDTKDPNTLVGMIRELVEETNQWDRSLFKDRNFKAMIDGSKHALNGTQNHGCVVAEELSPRDDGIAWEDKSCEVDLSLLGLDIFRSGGETFIPCAEKKEHLVGDDIKPHMVSWEDNLTNWPVEQSKE